MCVRTHAATTGFYRHATGLVHNNRLQLAHISLVLLIAEQVQGFCRLFGGSYMHTRAASLPQRTLQALDPSIIARPSILRLIIELT